MWHSTELLFAFYLTEVGGMAAGMMAIVIAVSLCASGAMDILVGHALRHHVRCVASAARVQLLGACTAGAMFFLFLATQRASDAPGVAAALVTGLAFRLAYAVYDVPQNAILGLAAGGHALRARLSSLRFICSGLAALTIAATAPLLLDKGRQAERFLMLGLGVGLMAACTSLLFHGIARRAACTPHPACAGPAKRGTHASSAAGHTIAWLLWLAFVTTAANGVFVKLEPYFAAQLLDTAFARGTLMVAVACGGIASQAFALWKGTRWPTQTVARLFAMAAAGGALGFLAGSAHAAWAPAAAFAIGFGLNGLGMLLWTALANTAAAAAKVRTALAPTVIFGLLTCSQKTASALSVLFVSLALGHTGAPAIVLAMGGAPLAGALVCLAAAARLKRQGAA